MMLDKLTETSRQEFSRAIADIRALATEDEYEGDLSYCPTQEAVDEAEQLLNGAYGRLDTPFPHAAVTSDGRQGIYIYWRKPSCNVQLAIPAHRDGSRYIYHQLQDDYAMETSVSPETLAYWLNWFAAQ